VDDQSDNKRAPPELGSARSPTMGDLFWVGTACAISVVAGLGLGYWADQWLNTSPWLTFAGLAFGIVSAVLLTVRQLRPFV